MHQGHDLRRLALQLVLEPLRRDDLAEGRLYGFGFATAVEPAMSNMGYISNLLTAEERERAGPKNGAVSLAMVNVDPLGTVSVTADTMPQGQGHETTLAQIVAECPEVKLVVTSRERLNLRAERRFPVEGLDYPEEGETDTQANYSALDLFSERARREIPDYTIPEEDYADVIRICQVLEGLPLGIELAAAWVDTISPTEIVDIKFANFHLFTVYLIYHISFHAQRHAVIYLTGTHT